MTSEACLFSFSEDEADNIRLFSHMKSRVGSEAG